MRRRDLFRLGAGGAAVAGFAALPLTACGCATASLDDLPAAEDLAAAAHRHFIPGGLTCSEAIACAGCEALGLESELLPDIALGLGGGVGLQGGCCGAISGCAMCIGLAVGAQETEYKPRKIRTMMATWRIHEAFREEFGSHLCTELSGLDLTNAADRKKLIEGVKEKTCAPFVRRAAALLHAELVKIAKREDLPKEKKQG